MKLGFTFLAFTIYSTTASAQFTNGDILKAKAFFAEAKHSADNDNGKLWQHYLYGPMIFVDPKTKEAVANEPDSAGLFKITNGVYRGTVPDNFAFANTAQHWHSKVWTVVLWPLPENRLERSNLMMHELFHQLQQITALPKTDANCQHLETMEGRLLLKVELEALKKVINDYPKFNRSDLVNALVMRAFRYQKFPGADSLEMNLEMNEGLAEATGLLLSGRTNAEMRKKLVSAINDFYQKPSFVRSMAYVTGPVYGYLLNINNKGWNKLFMQTSAQRQALFFSNLLMKNYNLSSPQNIEAAYNNIAANNLYNFDSIYAFEKNREDLRLKMLAINKAKFIDGPVLILPNANMNFVFNPNEVQVIDGYGPVYPTFSGKADWGNLEVKKGGAFIKDWMQVYVPLPPNFDDSALTVTNDNWQLELKPGWIIKNGKRAGDYEVAHE